MMATILIVEDDSTIRTLLTAQLEDQYTILTANNGQAALNTFFEHPVNLLICDVMMPEMDGFTLVKKLREDGFDQPVLMLTAKTTIHDKTTGFTLGADDYLTKPVDYTELKLRVAALMRRAKINTKQEIKAGSTILNANASTITINDQQQELPKKEFQLLFKLLSYPGKIFTQAQLLDDIWGFNNESTEDTVKTHISRIRKVIKNSSDIKITTVRGLGYKGEFISHD